MEWWIGYLLCKPGVSGSIPGFTSLSDEPLSRGPRLHMSRDMRFPTMWYVRPAEAQTSLRIRAD